MINKNKYWAITILFDKIDIGDKSTYHIAKKVPGTSTMPKLNISRHT